MKLKKQKTKNKKTCVDENSEILSNIKLDYDIENLTCNCVKCAKK